MRFAVQVSGDRLQSTVGVTEAHWVSLSHWATAALLDNKQPIVSGAIVTMLAALTHSGRALNPWSEPRTSNIGNVILACVEDKVGKKGGGCVGLFSAYQAVFVKREATSADTPRLLVP